MTPPAAIVATPALGAWLDVDEAVIEVRIGKVELGQGILTALTQVAADALGVPMTAVRVVPARTDRGPDQGATAGSLSVSQTAPALQHAGAVVRALTGGLDADGLAAYVAKIAALDPATDLADPPAVDRLPPVSVGHDVDRVDLPDKVLGRPRYLTDLRPPGLLHGRVLRSPAPGARLRDLDPGAVPEGLRVVRDGSFVGVVGDREAEVDRALDALRDSAVWSEGAVLPAEHDLGAWLRDGPHEDIAVVDDGALPDPTHTASYSRPFLVHASIAPSSAMARWDDGRVHVWTHSQGIHPLRRALATTLDTSPDAIVVEHVESAGCYGHNGADDAALDAALLARGAPGRPVLVRWSRADELTVAPLSSAMSATVRAALSGGRIVGWEYDVWSLGHTARPGYRGAPGLLAGADLSGAYPLPDATDPPLTGGAGTTRNAVPDYDVGTCRVTGHRRTGSPLRTSAMRSLGAFLNVFAIESFVDELASAAGVDPVEFRLAHLTDERAARVVTTAVDLGGWEDPLPESGGRGIGFARYKGTGAWCAVVAEVAAETDVRVRRLTVVADIGTVVNPDGARNQLEGGAVQATSWTTRERVRFDRQRIRSDSWESYPILRFSETPMVSAHLLDPTAADAPPLGAGEAAQGPTAAAIGNAVHHALGVRVRDLPLDADAIVRAIEATE